VSLAAPLEGGCGRLSPLTAALGGKERSPWCPARQAPALARGGGMARSELGLSHVLEEEEDLRASLNSLLPCFLAS